MQLIGEAGHLHEAEQLLAQIFGFLDVLTDLLKNSIAELFHCRLAYFVSESLKDFKFFALDLIEFELIVTDFIDHCLHHKGYDVLIL